VYSVTLIFSLFCALLLPNNIYALTELDPVLVTDKVLTKEQGPYLVSGFVEIPAGVILSVDPGVTVYFSDDGYLEVSGRFVARGTPTELVQLTSIQDLESGTETNYPFWNIETTGAGEIELIYTHLRRSEGGVWVNRTVPKIEHVLIEDFGGVGLLNTRESAVLTDIHVRDSYSGVYLSDTKKKIRIEGLVGIDANPLSLIRAKDVELVDARVLFTQPRNVAAVYARSSGLRLDNVTLLGMGRGQGVWSDHSTTTLASTTIEGFRTGIWTLEGNVQIEFSDIRANGNGIERAYTGPVILGFWEQLRSLFEVQAQSVSSDILRIENSSVRNNNVGILNNTENEVIATNVFWGDATGPYHASNPEGLGNEVTDLVSFRPWLTEVPVQESETACCSGVLFIPGFQGSRLYRQESRGGEDRLWEPNANADGRELHFSSTTRNPVTSGIYARDLVKPISAFEVYGQFEEWLQEFASRTNRNAGIFVYDWRYSPRQIVRGEYLADDPMGNTSESLRVQFRRLKEAAQNGKVTILVHSNGGLVVKEFIKTLEDSTDEEDKDLLRSIDKVVFVATPHLGAPQTIAALMFGYEQSIFFGIFQNKASAKKLGRDIPAPYYLLPTEKYYEHISTSTISFEQGGRTFSGINLSPYGRGVLNFQDQKSFLLASLDPNRPSYNSLLMPVKLDSQYYSDAEAFHSTFDNYQLPEHIRTFVVAGTGVPTLARFSYIDNDGTLDTRPTLTLAGDGTVPVVSATEMKSTTEAFYFDLYGHNTQNKNRAHASILSTKPVQTLLESIIVGSSTETIAHISQASSTYPGLSFSQISIHSPVSLELVDAQGRITNATTTEIPNSYYFEFGEAKYAGFVAGSNVQARLKGTGSGTFTTIISHVSADGVESSMQTVEDLPVSTALSGRVLYTGTSTRLELDVDSDGRVDTQIDTSKTLTPLQYLELIRGYVLALEVPPRVKKELLKEIGEIQKKLQKNKKTKNIRKEIQGFAREIKRSRLSKRHLGDSERDLLIRYIQQLLTNLN
jgi:hypothetical protein